MITAKGFPGVPVSASDPAGDHICPSIPTLLAFQIGQKAEITWVRSLRVSALITADWP